MLYEEWKSRYKNLKNLNTVLQRCPRFWPLAPPRGMNPGVYSLGISEDPPRYLSSKFDASVRSDCWDIRIWKTLTQCDGNGNANANTDDRGDYNSSPCTSYRRAKNVGSFCSAKATHIFSAKNIRILYTEFAKTVNEMILTKLVKLTMLWTTGPRYLKKLIRPSTHHPLSAY